METSIQTPALKRGRGRPRRYESFADARVVQAECRIEKSEHATKTRGIELLLVTIKQAAEALQVSEGTIVNLLKEGRLGSIKIGDARRIPLDAIKLLATTGATLTHSPTNAN